MTDLLETPISESRRQPATIQVIRNVREHPNAEKLEMASVLGYQVVVGKGEFNDGDPVVFIEEDSILPEGPEWSEFLRKQNFRVKARKLRGELSQGLALPVEILATPFAKKLREVDFLAQKVGINVSKQLGVHLYQPPMSRLTGQQSGLFPTYVPKTDELRLQSYPDVLEELRGKPYYITVKYDGMSGTFIKLGGKLVMCSRNFQLNQSIESPFTRVAESLDLLNRIPEGYAVQGEVVGPKIQGNPLELKSYHFYAFNVRKFGEDNRYLDYVDLRDCLNEWGIPMVDVTERDDCFSYSLEDLLDISKGTYLGTDNPREGIVVRPQKETWSKTLQGRLSFKIINPDFLVQDHQPKRNEPM